MEEGNMEDLTKSGIGLGFVKVKVGDQRFVAENNQAAAAAAAARRRRIEIRRLKDIANAANPSSEPMNKRSRAACEEEDEEEDYIAEREEDDDEREEESVNDAELDLDLVTKSFHVFPSREENKQEQQAFESAPSSPSVDLDDVETLSVDSSLVSYNSEEENVAAIDAEVNFERPNLALAADACSSSSSRFFDDSGSVSAHRPDLRMMQNAAAAVVGVVDSSLVPRFGSEAPHLLLPNGPASSLPLSEQVNPPSVDRIRCLFENSRTPPWAFVSIPGRRPEMEDAVAVVPTFYSLPSIALQGCIASANSQNTTTTPESDPAAMHFFGVYDGHGGAQASNYCKIRLHQALAEELESVFGDSDIGTGKWQKQWEKALMDCFKKVDAEVGQEPMKRNDGEQDPGLDCCAEPVAPETVGTTAVVAIVGACQVIVANCGDSRAVLCRGGKAIPLSADHKPQREDETARIEAAGGKVICWNGYRVLGVLAMSRAIGDRYLKPCIIPDPEVTFTHRVKEDDCLILASDGLWDVVSNQEACDIARKRIARWHNSDQSSSSCKLGDDSMDPASQAAAGHLCKLAIQRGSSDNITVLVVDLKAKRRKRSQK